MISVRWSVLAAMVLAIAGCANGGGYYSQYPNQGYYDGGSYYEGGPSYPYYGSGYDYDDNDDNRYFHPAHGVTCDRKRDVCSDRFGLSYFATAQYLGDREANRAYKRYGNKVLLFSPRPGVTCDRRTQTCSNGKWVNSSFNDDGRNANDWRPRDDLGTPNCPPRGCLFRK